MDIFSVGEISKRLSVPLHRIEYLIRTRQIKPCVAAGGRNFYSHAVIDRIAAELQRIEEERSGLV